MLLLWDGNWMRKMRLIVWGLSWKHSFTFAGGSLQQTSCFRVPGKALGAPPLHSCQKESLSRQLPGRSGMCVSAPPTRSIRTVLERPKGFNLQNEDHEVPHT